MEIIQLNKPTVRTKLGSKKNKPTVRTKQGSKKTQPLDSAPVWKTDEKSPLVVGMRGG